MSWLKTMIQENNTEVNLLYGMSTALTMGSILAFASKSRWSVYALGFAFGYGYSAHCLLNSEKSAGHRLAATFSLALAGPMGIRIIKRRNLPVVIPAFFFSSTIGGYHLDKWIKSIT